MSTTSLRRVITVFALSLICVAGVVAQTPAAQNSDPSATQQPASTGQTQNGPQTSGPAATVPPVTVTAKPKSHKVRKVVLTCVIVGEIVLAGMAGGFHD